MNDKCYVYDCSNRNYYGYCKTTVCINPKYNKITNCTRDAADKFVAKPVTNADRIRSMTDEELAEYLDGVCHDLWQMFVRDPKKMWLEWLKEEVKNNG